MFINDQNGVSLRFFSEEEKDALCEMDSESLKDFLRMYCGK